MKKAFLIVGELFELKKPGRSPV